MLALAFYRWSDSMVSGRNGRGFWAGLGISVHAIALATIMVGSVACSSHISAQDGAKPKVSVEQCTAMLQSIDPYQPRVQVEGKVAVFGSTSMDAMAHGWSAGFKRFHREAEIVVSAAGSEATFDELIKNPSGVGMLSRPVTDKELDELKKKGLKQPVAFIVAREALGVFVHPDNPVKSISGQQLRAVFTGEGEVTWGQLGATGEWASKPIHVISRGERSGTQKFLQDFVFAGSDLRPGVSAHASNAEVIKAISDDALAIGICGLRSNHKSVKPLQLMSGASVVPSDDHAILTG
ncbi:MAG: substrate-binding domain-containing protein, partial [Planctomycetota bacterium]